MCIAALMPEISATRFHFATIVITDKHAKNLLCLERIILIYECSMSNIQLLLKYNGKTIVVSIQ